MRISAAADLVRHARAASEVRARAVPLLVKLLEDPEPRVRGAAAVALGDLEANDALPALLMAVEDDASHVRQMAINALGEIGDVRALSRLRRALSDPRPEVRYQSVIAFARIADREGGVDVSEVDDALFEAASDPDDAIAHIALRVAEERLDEGRALDGRLRARARAILTELEGASPNVVLVAAILLAKAGDDRGRDVVLRVVRGEGVAGGRARKGAPDKEDERAAVELAGELGLTEAAPALERRAWGVARLVRDTCPFHARIALARMGHDRAKHEILSELTSRRRETLAGAVVSAGRARLVEAREAIARLTASEVDPDLVREALARLGG